MEEYLLEMFGVSLVLTVLIEWAVIFLFLRFVPVGHLYRREEAQKRMGRKAMVRTLLLSVPVNILTNPLAVLLCWLGRMYLGQGLELLVQLLVEALVVVVEARIYCSFAKKPGWETAHPVLLAVTANVSSYLMGGLLNRLVL